MGRRCPSKPVITVHPDIGIDLPQDEQHCVLTLPVAEVGGKGKYILIEALHGSLLQHMVNSSTLVEASCLKS